MQLIQLITSNIVQNGLGVERQVGINSVVELVVEGTGAVSATARIWAKNRIMGEAWTDLGTITASGTTSAVISDTVEVPWQFLRADITAISGTGAVATVTQSGI